MYPVNNQTLVGAHLKIVLADVVSDSPDLHDNRAVFSQAQPRTATRCRARDPGPIATPHYRGGGNRQDEYAGPSRCASHHAGFRPASDYAADLFTSGGCGDDSPSGTHCGACSPKSAATGGRWLDLVWDLPRDRRAGSARICRTHRTRPRLHHS